MATALRTPIRPTVYVTEDDNAAVYAVHPPITFDSGSQSTAFVLVASSISVRDTVIHPCDKDGQMLGWDLIAHVLVPVHSAALRDIGYDLEVIANG